MIKRENLNNPIVCVVAMNQNRIIGDGKTMPWHIPGDLKRLKAMTMGAPLIMGRKTWDSIKRPLPGRANIVLTKSKFWTENGAIVVNTFEEAIKEADSWIEKNKKVNEKTQNKIFLFGGAQIYNLGLKYCSNIEITKVKFDLKNGLKFPKLDALSWHKTKIKHFKAITDIPEFSYWSYKRIVKI